MYTSCIFCLDDINMKSIDSIQRSVAMICLDQPNPDIRTGRSTNDEMTVACARGLHGNGVARNSGNRWFDKTMQV